MSSTRLAIIGAGAAGCFCAANIAENTREFDITIFESSDKPMHKLSLTGGGRCNITNTFDAVGALSHVYPRGANLLKKLFYNFDHNALQEWFLAHGVTLFAQDDGRVFPTSQNALQIVDTLYNALIAKGVTIKTNHRLSSLQTNAEGKFILSFDEKPPQTFDIVVVATGGTSPAFLDIFRNLGIETIEPVPSLFTFTIKDPDLNALMGATVDDASCSIAGTKFSSEGSILVTHWGMSGPAILKLSSYAARYLKENKYTSNLIVNWLNTNEEYARNIVFSFQSRYPQKTVLSVRPDGITNRMWLYITNKCGIDGAKRWSEVSKKNLNRLVSILISDTYKIQGRGHYKEEFVTSGGISLNAVSSKTLESKAVKNLYFVGEVLDIDAVTGGFNLQSAWTTAYTAAMSIVNNQNKSN